MHSVSEFTHSFSFTPSSELYEWTNVGKSEWGYRGRFQIQPRRTGGGPFKPAQIRLSYIRSLKYHLVVMLGARIDVIQPQIWIFSKKNRRQLWLNAIKRADWTETIVKHDHVCKANFLSEKVQKKYCLLLLWARLKISCISRIYCACVKHTDTL